MIVMGVDPGYAIVGYGVVEYKGNHFTPLRYGAITTPAEMPFPDRLAVIYNELSALIALSKPDAFSVEQLFFTTNQKTAIAVGQARGVIVLSAVQQSVPVFEYTPLQVKQSVVGYGKAVKQQVMDMTKRLLNLKEIPKPDDTADALALAICHAHSCSSVLIKEHYVKNNAEFDRMTRKL